MPQILIDGSVYTFAPSGGAFHFLNGLMAHLPKDPSMDFRLIKIPPPTTIKVPDGKVKDLLRPFKRRLDFFLQRRGGEKKSASLYHSIYYYPCPDPSIPMITMVHDLITEKFPTLYDQEFTRSLRLAKEKCIGKSARYICISECTKHDLIEVYGIPSADIDVVHHAIDTRVFHPASGINRAHDIPYFLYVGGRLHHKNFERLAIAFSESGLSKDYVLKVAGTPWEPHELELLKKLGIQNRVTLIPSPTSLALADLYRECTGFVFPSLYEGFGIPLIEAMGCGAPIAASNTGPFPEIGGNAILYFDPLDPSSISKALQSLTNSELRRGLTAKGLLRAGDFSWEKTIEGTMRSYEKVLRRTQTSES